MLEYPIVDLLLSLRGQARSRVPVRFKLVLWRCSVGSSGMKLWTGSDQAPMLVCTLMEGHLCPRASHDAVCLPSFSCLVLGSPSCSTSPCGFVQVDVCVRISDCRSASSTLGTGKHSRSS